MGRWGSGKHSLWKRNLEALMSMKVSPMSSGGGDGFGFREATIVQEVEVGRVKGGGMDVEYAGIEGSGASVSGVVVDATDVARALGVVLRWVSCKTWAAQMFESRASTENSRVLSQG